MVEKERRRRRRRKKCKLLINASVLLVFFFLIIESINIDVSMKLLSHRKYPFFCSRQNQRKTI